MMPAQYGIGAVNQCLETNTLGLTGWVQWQVVTQPSNGWLLIMPYPSQLVFGQADICININCTPTNSGGGNPPVANPDNATTPQNTPVTIVPLANDIINGTYQSITIKSQPANGTAVVSGKNFTI